MKTKIILTVGCVGKTYVDSNYINIYDFDKHTLVINMIRLDLNIFPMKNLKVFPEEKLKRIGLNCI